MEPVLAITVVLSITLVLWLHADEDLRERSLVALGLSRKQAISPLPKDNSRLVAALVFIALLVVINPEARLLLLFIDGVGIDVFLMLVLFQLRDIITWAHRTCVPTLRRMLLNWGPIPFSVPTPVLFRRHPVLSVCSVLSPVVPLGLFAALSFSGCIMAITLVRAYA
jgi:hypothetical protein